MYTAAKNFSVCNMKVMLDCVQKAIGMTNIPVLLVFDKNFEKQFLL
jgi:hypothetical protein